MLLKELLPSLKTYLYSMGRLNLGPWWSYDNVNSPFTRIIYLPSGEAEITIDGSKCHVKSGDMILVPPFIPADYHCPEKADHYYAIFRAELAQGLELFSLPEISRHVVPASDYAWCFERLLKLNSNIALEALDPSDQAYNEQIWRAGPTNESRSSRDLLETDGLLRLLLSAFIKTSKKAVMKNDSSVARLIRILTYIENNLDKSITLEDMAKEVSLHPTYFSDLFVKQMGERPISYLTRARVGKAQILLATTDKPVKDIAWELGFKDVNYFHRVFKKRLRLSPGQWRKHFARHNTSQDL